MARNKELCTKCKIPFADCDCAAPPSKRLLQNRMNGRRGGLTTAARHTPEYLSERARKAGQAAFLLHGKGLYQYILKFRKKKPNGKVDCGWREGRPRKEPPKIGRPSSKEQVSSVLPNLPKDVIANAIKNNEV